MAKALPDAWATLHRQPRVAVANPPPVGLGSGTVPYGQRQIPDRKAGRTTAARRAMGETPLVRGEDHVGSPSNHQAKAPRPCHRGPSSAKIAGVSPGAFNTTCLQRPIIRAPRGKSGSSARHMCLKRETQTHICPNAPANTLAFQALLLGPFIAVERATPTASRR